MKRLKIGTYRFLGVIFLGKLIQGDISPTFHIPIIKREPVKRCITPIESFIQVQRHESCKRAE